LYSSAVIDVDSKVDVSIDSGSIYDVLDQTLKKTDIRYKVKGRQILLSKKEDSHSITSNQQKASVSGTVTDSSGKPLPGVTVVIKSTTKGTVTNTNGNFSLNNVSEDATLVFSFIGMSSQEISVNGQSTINITMEDESLGIDEVVAIGYGSVKKSVVTGAISTVQMEKIQPMATQRVDQMLQGRAAGVMVLNTDGAPGGNTTIRIRGMNSIQGGNDALIVIDGFQGGDLDALNPNDIASIEILKDASATAIYGSQGANGVILIETKKGKTDRPVINLSTEFGVSNILMGGIELMDAAEYAREMNRVEMADNYDRTPVPFFSDAEIAELERTGGVDWVDEIYRAGVTKNYQLSLSGKTENVNYFLSGSMLDQEGILINSGYKRYSLRANVSANINEWLSCGINWDGVQRDKTGVGFGSEINYSANPITVALLYPPTLPIYNEDGSYSRPSDLYGARVWNPVASAVEPEVEKKHTQNIINLFLEFKLLEGLTFKMTGGAKINNRTDTEFYSSETRDGIDSNGLARVTNAIGRSFQNSNILNYSTDIGKHHINAVVVGEIKYSEGFNFYANNSQFVVQETGVYNLGGADIQRTGSSFFDRKINSALTRVNYGYDNKYVCSFSYRADGSSVFGANNKWAYFPSASLGWRITREEFMRDISPINNLMFRFSWGRTGNQAIGTYQTLAKVSSAGFYPWDGGENSNLGFQISSASNPSLKWETTRQTNIGLDVALFNSKLRFTAEYYDKVTEDLLMQREIPRSTGLSSIIDNVGSMGNKGWEFTLDGDLRLNKLRWSTGLSFSTSKTTVLDLGEDDFLSYAAGGSGHSTNIPFMFLTEGQPFGQIMGFGYEGTWNVGEEEEAGRYGQMPGNPRYTDVNNDGRIDYDNDWKVIGNALPDFIFGITNQLNYNKWELTFLFQGTYGNDIFNVARTKRESVGVGYSKDLLNRWTEDNQNTDIPALIDGQTWETYRLAWDDSHPDNPFVSTISFPKDGGNVYSRWIEDGSYIRLKNVTLAYTFPSSKYFNNLRVYANATNLFTWTNYSGADPEVSSFTDSDAQLGTDYNNYPQSRIISFGLNVTF
jgi:TonB-linked SusC/RagA family outer membrane protein